jgi:hypothetical protein
MTISNAPIKVIRFDMTFVKNLSFINDPNTKKLKNIADKMNGKGTGDPGLGTHAVLFSLMV